MRQVLRYALLLFALEAVASGLAFLLSDWAWLAVLVAPAFLWLVWMAGASFAAERDRPGAPWLGALAAALAQWPGLQGSVRFLTDTTGLTEYDGVTDLQDFLMQTWHTVFLPLLALLPNWRADGYYALYYVGVVVASPLLVVLFAAAAWMKQRRPGHR